MKKTIFMRKEDADKVLTALRSGEYEQGRGRLMTNDGKFCCLGVMEHCLTGDVQRLVGDLNNESLGLPTLEWLRAHKIRFVSPYEYSDVSSGYVHYNGVWLSLHGLNDSAKLPFSKIADLIEQHLEYVD